MSIATKSHEPLMLRRLERVVPVKDVGRLPEGQPEVGPVERNVAEPDEPPPFGLLRRNPVVPDAQPGQWHTSLHATLHVDELDLHVNGGFELGMGDFELAKLGELSRLGSLGRRGTLGHAGIVPCVLPIIGWSPGGHWQRRRIR
jgi:hypothetical protein